MVWPSKCASARLECIPILHVRGTHFNVGKSIGRMFKGMIQDLVETWDYFNNTLWKIYKTDEGKEVYGNCLQHCMNKYPQYVEEIKGMAEGSKVPFEKLFLINIDTIMTASAESNQSISDIHLLTGCTSIICNKDETLLGHTEDAMTEILNNVYIVQAEILDQEDQIVEEFTSFSYAGHLMGYTMGFNPHGMVYSVNTLFPKEIHQSGTPRAFIARAILGAKNLDELIKTLKDTDSGVSDGFSLNVIFTRSNAEPNDHDDHNEDESNTLNRLYNVEVSPPKRDLSSSSPSAVTESLIDILPVLPGQSYTHSNKYLRICTPEHTKPFINSSIRHDTINQRFPESSCIEDIEVTLSDQSNKDVPIFICDKGCNVLTHCRTVAVGIFDIKKKTWSVYVDKPTESKPTVVIQMDSRN